MFFRHTFLVCPEHEAEKIPAMHECPLCLRVQRDELLKACKAALESSSSRTGGECRCGACDLARAAIAKVEAA